MNGFTLDSIQDAVNEPPGILGAESFPEFNGLVQCHLGRDFFAVDELESGHAENGAINDVHSIQSPIFRVFSDQLIDLLTVLQNAKDETFHKIISLSISRKMILKLSKRLDRILFSEI